MFRGVWLLCNLTLADTLCLSDDKNAAFAGIHLEKDMSVPFGHTVARTVCLFEILCAPKSVECAFF